MGSRDTGSCHPPITGRILATGLAFVLQKLKGVGKVSQLRPTHRLPGLHGLAVICKDIVWYMWQLEANVGCLLRCSLPALLRQAPASEWPASSGSFLSPTPPPCDYKCMSQGSPHPPVPALMALEGLDSGLRASMEVFCQLSHLLLPFLPGSSDVVETQLLITFPGPSLSAIYEQRKDTQLIRHCRQLQGQLGPDAKRV